ncbi:hypothetical protein [Aquabacterium sp.]|uniref:hypothetical protein n=1 Tax=Aquabacterium sp. TaxID=1872578 RepID=UPI002C5319F1|nr:hypothetical protein [Aquabacterium sp.]HSW06488.1 hypothetical protein [Aquabacterium sp.]
MDAIQAAAMHLSRLDQMTPNMPFNRTRAVCQHVDQQRGILAAAPDASAIKCEAASNEIQERS